MSGWTNTRATFSPHAWGCSVVVPGVSGLRVVFPTRVGMFRLLWSMVLFLVCFPHTRGDVPSALRSSQPIRRFSPHAWGCSESQRTPGHSGQVFPTRVGMFRKRTTKAVGRHKFSPHAWGCSGHLTFALRFKGVFPTRVGMFRGTRPAPCRSRGFPHTRGDVPCLALIRQTLSWFSPHAWGCSV